MDLFDSARAALSPWAGGLDERGFAQFHELAMARAPLRRLVSTVLPARGSLGRSGDERPERDGLGPRSRPVKRWQPGGAFGPR